MLLLCIIGKKKRGTNEADEGQRKLTVRKFFASYYFACCAFNNLYLSFLFILILCCLFNWQIGATIYLLFIKNEIFQFSKNRRSA